MGMPVLSLLLGALALVLNAFIIICMAFKAGWVVFCLLVVGVGCALAAIVLSAICLFARRKKPEPDDRPVWGLVTGIFSAYFSAWSYLFFNPF